MKYFIFTDIHGMDLSHLEKIFEIENPDVLICMGDFDQIKPLMQFKEFEKEFLSKGKQVIKVPGNHDYSIFHNLPVYSGTLNMQGKTSEGLHNEFKNDIDANSYLSDLVNSDQFVEGFLNKNKFGERYSFAVVHGGYDGNLFSYPLCPKEEEMLWFRMKNPMDFALNFHAMRKRDKKIMIRGHDHKSSFAKISLDEEKISVPKPNLDYELNGGGIYIINPGAFFDGNYAIIDTLNSLPLVKWKNFNQS